MKNSRLSNGQGLWTAPYSKSSLCVKKWQQNKCRDTAHSNAPEYSFQFWELKLSSALKLALLKGGRVSWCVITTTPHPCHVWHGNQASSTRTYRVPLAMSSRDARDLASISLKSAVLHINRMFVPWSARGLFLFMSAEPCTCFVPGQNFRKLFSNIMPMYEWSMTTAVTHLLPTILTERDSRFRTISASAQPRLDSSITLN